MVALRIGGYTITLVGSWTSIRLLGLYAEKAGRIGDEQRQARAPRLDYVGVLVRASPSLAAGMGIAEDEVARKRWLLAMFCRMLGEQLLDAKSPPSSSEPLSPREQQTLELLLSGNAEKQIAGRLAISRHTVHVYVKSLYKRFGVCSRGELLAKWVRR